MRLIKIIRIFTLLSFTLLIVVLLSSCATHKTTVKGSSVGKAAPIKEVDVTIKKITPKSTTKK